MKKKAIKSKNIIVVGTSPEPVSALPLRKEVLARSETRDEPASAVTKMLLPKPTLLELLNAEAKSVSVAGSFNGWNPQKTPLHRNANGRWAGDVMLEPGRHEYLFVVDGKWLPDPKAREQVGNPFGGHNSVIVVTG